MGNLITVFKGDEHRAKIEPKLKKDDFFDGVYLRAHKELKRIVDETKLYKEENKGYGFRIKYQGMGNNRIIFTAGRGQGKTSAMQSYAEYLRNPERGEELLRPIENVKFQVLDAIDPSSLDQGENIIRVLISRLFFSITKMYDSKEINFDDNMGMMKSKEALLKLFRACYNNLVVLKENQKQDDFQDDLEHLSQLGNSAKLKENLHDLIEMYLQIIGKAEGYLVVQIDDVDLFKGNVFEICEDIHIYLSVPNVIVLMAADYTQLRYSLCERYLSQYKELQDKRSKVEIYDRCHETAARYLEKIFPDGHRIELPIMQEMTLEEYSQLKILYKEKPNKKKIEDIVDVNESAAKTDQPLENLRSYLVQMLYARTGVVLLNTQSMIHPFFPHTMRELAHFLNLLEKMEVVDFIKVCRYFYGPEEAGRGADDNIVAVQNLKNNLLRLKQYFLNDWCPNHLDEAQINIIREIDASPSARKLKVTTNRLCKYMKNIGEAILSCANDSSYHEVMFAVEENEALQQRIDLQYAIFLHYTIFLNEWFVNSLLIEDMSDFINFVETPIFYSPKYIDAKYKGYRITCFDVLAEELKKNVASSEEHNVSGRVKRMLQTFCYPEEEKDMSDNDDESIAVRELTWWIEDIWGVDYNAQIINFDFLRPLGQILKDRGWTELAEELAEDLNEGGETKEDQDVLELYVSIKNIMTNFEVQQYIQRKLEKYRKKYRFMRVSEVGYADDEEWIVFYRGAYNILDQWEKESIYKGELRKNGIGKVLAYYLIQTKLLKSPIIFLTNAENREKYCTQYKELILHGINSLLAELKEMQETLAGVSLEQLTSKVAHFTSWTAVEWDKLYPEIFGNPKVFPMPEIKQLTTYCEELQFGYEKVHELYRNFLLEALEAMKKAQKLGAFDLSENLKGRTKLAKVGRNLQSEIPVYRAVLARIQKECGDQGNASAKRKS